MGNIICGSNDLLKKLDEMCNNSPVLRAILDEIREEGNLEIRITPGKFSFYENRTIALGLEQLHKPKDLESTLIMEICNACCDIRGLKPHPGKFSTAEAYGEAVEKQEWGAIKKHIKIHKESLPTDASLGKSRFQQAFDDPKCGWDNFDNYLKFQQDQGHTQQIQSHWVDPDINR